jgi:hypothetical protein
MKNSLFATIACVLLSLTSSFAQDFIVLRNGTDIKSKVTELTPTEVKYKAFDNLNGPTITIEKATVFMLRYENGKTEVINVLTTDKPTEKPTEKITEKTAEKTVQKPTEKPTSVAPTPPSVKTPKNTQNAYAKDSTAGFTGAISVGSAFAIGSYAATNLDDNERAGGAKTGFSVGSQLGYRINKDMRIFLEGQLVVNPYEIKIQDARNIYTMRGDWSHFALMVGSDCEWKLSNNMGFYLSSAIGVGFSSMKGDFAKVLEYTKTQTRATSLATSLSLGLRHNKHFMFGFSWLTASPTFSDFEPAVNSLQLICGYQF